jgi:DNA-binding CsgD family transcriptional regulator
MDVDVTPRYPHDDHLYHRSGEPMLPTSHEGTWGLSECHRTILTLLASGLTSTETGDVLRIPMDELRAEVRDIIRALGARSKLEAVVIALRRGLIQLPDDRHDWPGPVPAYPSLATASGPPKDHPDPNGPPRGAQGRWRHVAASYPRGYKSAPADWPGRRRQRFSTA